MIAIEADLITVQVEVRQKGAQNTEVKKVLETDDRQGTIGGHAGADQSMLTFTCLGFSSSGFGISISRTPFLNRALILSGFTAY